MVFRILSLSGGGVRGIYQAVYLEHLMSGKQPLRDCLDLIAGTSTGAIIALGVALDIAPSTIASLFIEKGGLIFPTKTRRSALRSWAWFFKGPRYSIEPLRKELRETFGNHVLSDCKTHVIVPATTLDTYHRKIFTTLARRGLPASPDNGLLAADVAMASSAGPLYFPAVDVPPGTRDSRTYVDGGIWANTPALAAIMEAHKWLGIPFDQMRVVSIGNGEVPKGEVGMDFNKLRRMSMVSPILDMMFATQALVAEEAVKWLIGEQNLLLVNTWLPEHIDLDDMEKALRILPHRAVQDGLNDVENVRPFLGIAESAAADRGGI